MTSAPNAWTDLLRAGLMTCVPVLGAIALTGWTRRIFGEVRDGRAANLLAMSFWSDLKLGWYPTVASTALLTAGTVLLTGLMGLCGALLEWVGEDSPAFHPLVLVLVLGGGLASLAYMVAGWVATVEVTRLLFEGHIRSLLRPGRSLRRIRTHSEAYLLASVGTMVAMTIGSWGAMFCGVGMAFTLPVGMAATAHLVGQWAALERESPA
ncbi:hypothetical protein L6R53_19785 [Myxococcota bacterium]|nr:hypothetical protein [Myxococcota bacterium]